jgi:hypothetical protein
VVKVFVEFEFACSVIQYDLELYKGFFMEKMTPNLLDFKGRSFFSKSPDFYEKFSTIGSQEYIKFFFFWGYFPI